MKNETFYKQLGKRIQFEREKMGLSRDKLADQIGVSAKFLYEIEGGKKGFSCEIFYQICCILHVDPTCLIQGRGPSTDKTKIDYMIRDFNKKEMSHLAKLIEEVCKLRNQDTGR